MEMISSSFKKKLLYGSLVTLLFTCIIYFQIWAEEFADYPFQDEYMSLLKTLNYPVIYSKTLYIQLLSGLTFFTTDFYQLYLLNFVLSNSALSMVFFWYHQRKGIELGTNMFFTAILALSSLNISLSRKLHFWEISFLLLVLVLQDFVAEKRRKYFLLWSFLILTFFRIEFLFPASVAFGLIIFEHRARRYFWVLLVFGLALMGIALTMAYSKIPGLAELIKISLPAERMFSHFFGLFYSNMTSYFLLCLDTFWRTLKNNLFTVINCFVLIFFMVASLKENLRHFIQTYKKDFLCFYLPLLIPFLFVRFFPAYLIVVYVLFLSILCFLLNSRNKITYPVLVFALLAPAFFFGRPDYANDLSANFNSRLYGGRVNKPMHNLVRLLKPAKLNELFPLSVLSYERLRDLVKVNKVDFYVYEDLPRACQTGPRGFDVVLISESWQFRSDKKLVESCVLSRMGGFKRYSFANGYILLVSDRVSPLGMDFGSALR